MYNVDPREPFPKYLGDTEFFDSGPEDPKVPSTPLDVCDWCGEAREGGMCIAKCRKWTEGQDDRPDPPPGPEPTCAWCGSTNIETRSYYFGVDPENGYSDSGTQVYCLDCGKADEL